MRIIGLDPASSIGYSIIDVENDEVKLVHFGEIQLPSSMNVPQKLNLAHVRLTSIMNQWKPDMCAVEDPPFTISGVKVLIKLARINGVCIQSAFEFLKDNVAIYENTYWKANSLDGLNGHSKKWQIQLEVCRRFNIPLNDDYGTIDKFVEQKYNKINELKSTINDKKTIITKLKSALKRKRNPLLGDEKAEAKNKLLQLSNELVEDKKLSKKISKEVDTELLQVGNDIFSQSGLSSDAADATCIAYCMFKQINEGLTHGQVR